MAQTTLLQAGSQNLWTKPGGVCSTTLGPKLGCYGTVPPVTAPNTIRTSHTPLLKRAVREDGYFLRLHRKEPLLFSQYVTVPAQPFGLPIQCYQPFSFHVNKQAFPSPATMLRHHPLWIYSRKSQHHHIKSGQRTGKFCILFCTSSFTIQKHGGT